VRYRPWQTALSHRRAISGHLWRVARPANGPAAILASGRVAPAVQHSLARAPHRPRDLVCSGRGEPSPEPAASALGLRGSSVAQRSSRLIVTAAKGGSDTSAPPAHHPRTAQSPARRHPDAC